MNVLKSIKGYCFAWPGISTSLSKKILIAIVLFTSVSCKKTGDSALQTANTDKSKQESAETSADEFFQIAVLPDTQYYTAEKHNGTMTMFQDQITWIRNNKTTSKIAYVVHLGDIVDHGEEQPIEWTRAKTELYKLETDNIPYGLSVGNHDQTPYGDPGSGATNNGYGVYFGKSHFTSKSWYGGAYGTSDNNDNHYDLFTANGVNYIVLYIEFNEEGYHTSTDPTEWYSPTIETNVMNWADGILNTYASRKAIIVSHSILNKPSGSNSDIKNGLGNNSIASTFTTQGNVIYNRMKLHNNVFLMLGGHKSGEGFRQDNYNGHIIKSYLSDYQSRQNSPFGGAANENGGNGLMRLMKFNKTQQTLSVRTFAPRTGSNILETDGDSEFTKPLYN